MMKAIKFRIEPNSKQRKAIDQMIDANRLVYNNMITACRLYYEKTKELPSSFDLDKIGTKMRHNSQYIAKAYSMTLNITAERVITASKNTLGIHKKESGEFNFETVTFKKPDYHFPRYKSYRQFNSFTYPSLRDYSIVIKNEGKKQKRMLKLGKVPGLVRCYNQSTEIHGTIKTCTIKRKNMGRYFEYYACIIFEPTPVPFTEAPKGPIGVDMGVHNIVALSDGTIFPNDHVFPKLKGALKKNHRKLSRTSPGTKEYKKIQTRINHIYNKITNHRRNTTEHISTYLVRNYSHIVMEKLSVKGLRSI